MRLNFRVRNENGCDPHVKAPKLNFQFFFLAPHSPAKPKRQRGTTWGVDFI